MSTDSVVRVWASVVLLMLATGVANAQVPSELKRLGFNGPVRTVKSEYMGYSWEGSRWQSYSDPIYDVVRFDRNGRRLTSGIDPGSGIRSTMPDDSKAGRTRTNSSIGLR